MKPVVELPLAVPAMPENTAEFADEYGVLVRGREGETLGPDGNWRKNGKFCGNPWTALREQERFFWLYQENQRGRLDTVDLEELEKHLYHSREQHWRKISDLGGLGGAKPCDTYDRASALTTLRKAGDEVICLGYYGGGNYVISRDLKHYANLPMNISACGYALKHSTERLVEANRWREPMSPLPVLEDYLAFLPYHRSHSAGFTHFVPTEEAVPMFEDMEAMFNWCNDELRAVDPELSVGTLIPGWLRQADRYYPNIPRERYLPGLDNMLYVGQLEHERRMVYFDDFAWELGVKLEGGGGLQASIYLTTDRRFICSSTCQVEMANTGHHQPLAGKVNKYTLQSWLSSAGLDKIRDEHGERPKIQRARPLRIAQVKPRPVNLKLLEYKFALASLMEEALTQPLSPENKLSPNRLELFMLPDDEENAYARWYLNGHAVRLYRVTNLGHPNQTVAWAWNKHSANEVIIGTIIVGAAEEVTLRNLLQQLPAVNFWKDEEEEEEEEHDDDDDDYNDDDYNEDEDRGNL